MTFFSCSRTSHAWQPELIMALKIKTLKSGSVAVTFSLDGVIYSMNLEHGKSSEEEINVGDNSQTTKVEIVKGPDKMTMKKIMREGSPPDFNISGEGPHMIDERQCKLFLANWIAVVVGQLHFTTCCGCCGGSTSLHIMSALGNFFILFNHYFGDKIAELMVEEENDDVMEVQETAYNANDTTNSAQPSATVSEDGCDADGKNVASGHANMETWFQNNDVPENFEDSALDESNADSDEPISSAKKGDKKNLLKICKILKSLNLID